MSQFHKSVYFIFFVIVGVIASFDEESQSCTDLARDEESLLLLSTLSGDLVALEPLTGVHRWAFEDEPPVKVPQPKDGQLIVPQFLPDPRDGSLYTWHNSPIGKSSSEGNGLLHKMPLTIPQLVANAPCRSSDGILYSGKKSDAWSIVDIKTGSREKIIGFNDFSLPSLEASRSQVLLGRSYYNILMYNAATKNMWNVTFVDYSAHTMSSDLLNEYDFVHLCGSASGRIATLDRTSGSLLWDRITGAPIVAMYILNRNGLLTVPFTTVSDDTLNNIISNTKLGNGKDIKLFPTLYVGEHLHGVYALPSLIDQRTAVIKDYPNTLLIEGPSNEFAESYKFVYSQKVGNNIHIGKTYLKDYQNYILLGHYDMPMSNDVKLQIGPNTDLVPLNQRNYPKYIEDKQIFSEQENKTNFILKVFNSTKKVNDVKRTIAVQTDTISENYFDKNINIPITDYFLYTSWLDFQENNLFKFSVIIVLGLLSIGICSIFYKLRVRSAIIGKYPNIDITGKSAIEGEETYPNLVTVGKITFNMAELLGKGCDGTFVYRGEFESRAVAVKRLLPECFSLAEREVTLLRESDTHPNVVRYYCTEQDRQFKYIALELCGATLQDYVDQSLSFKCNTPEKELLCQATDGLAHLHSLNIVHRDVKPHNVLLSLPTAQGHVRAMISDFGLCKKLLLGKQSFSKASGIAGTEGWIAPEMLNGERTTTAVDVFSLGCVFYYVLSHGCHPFGGPLHRQANILSGHSSLAALHDEPLAQNLLSSMISVQCESRPPISAVRLHPVFWNENRALSFLQDISDRLEKDSDSSEHMIELEREAHQVVRSDWRRYLDPSISEDLRKYRTYIGSSVRDLLRAIRNKKHHYHQLSPAAVGSLGALPVLFTRYWLERFPLLLVHVWGATQTMKQEPALSDYYPLDFDFPMWHSGKICDTCSIQKNSGESGIVEHKGSQLKITFLSKIDKETKEGTRDVGKEFRRRVRGNNLNNYFNDNNTTEKYSENPSVVNGFRHKPKKKFVQAPLVWSLTPDCNK